MATRPARRTARRNVGRGDKKVDGDKSKAGGQVSLADVGDSAWNAVTAARFGNIRDWSDAQSWIMEQAAFHYYTNPQTFRGFPTRFGAEADAAWAHSISVEGRVGPLVYCATGGEPAPRAGRKVHARNRSKGKQRP